MNSFSFEDKDPRFTGLKPGLALRLLSKGLFYIRAMPALYPLPLVPAPVALLRPVAAPLLKQ